MPSRYSVVANFEGNLDRDIIKNVLSNVFEFYPAFTSSDLDKTVDNILTYLDKPDHKIYGYPEFNFMRYGIYFEINFANNKNDTFRLTMNIGGTQLYYNGRHGENYLDWSWYINFLLNITTNLRLLSIDTLVSD